MQCNVLPSDETHYAHNACYGEKVVARMNKTDIRMPPGEKNKRNNRSPRSLLTNGCLDVVLSKTAESQNHKHTYIYRTQYF